MAPVALTKSQEIVEYLASFNTRKQTHSFLLRIHKKNALALCGIEPTQGFICLGAIACLEHDFVSMHKYHKQAIASSNNSNHSLTNYGISLRKSCLWRDALHYYEQTVEDGIPDDETFGSLLFLNHLLGHYNKSISLVKAWEELHPDKSHEYPDTYNYLQFIQELNIQENDIEQIMSFIGEVLSETDVIIIRCRISVFREDGNAFLNYELTPADPKQDIIELENIIDGHLTQRNFSKHILDHMTISFTNSDIDNIDNMLQCFETCMVENPESIIVPDSVQLRRIEELIDGVDLN
jgi:hypothetical protein